MDTEDDFRPKTDRPVKKIDNKVNFIIKRAKTLDSGSYESRQPDPIMDIFQMAKKNTEAKQAEKVEAFDPIMDIFAQSKKQAEKAQKVEKVEAFDPVMDIFAQSKKQAGKADKVDPVMEIFEKAKEKEQEKNNKKDTGPKLQQNFWEF
ncbi:hypothetical protein TrRE_jg2076 [Triparma retinervis]|uniref:Uncharacterized protein n=1 Tax=Triparma retinervis TaxID=2557542 RepID=A0A9W7E0U3_9STRA|nr:hypothetical protein TrRE_jg2076 [Triparma retinervis]